MPYASRINDHTHVVIALQPLFFGNSTNSYGKTLEAVYEKMLDIGFDGVRGSEFV